MEFQTIHERWRKLREHVAEIATGCGRAPDAVTIVGVTKYVDVATTAALVRSGCLDLGESRPQQLWDKAAQLAELSPRWHLIGHLQRNKVDKTIPLIAAIHSLDSLRLAEAISAAASKVNRTVACFVEVNISGEPAKTGLAFEELSKTMEQLVKLPGLCLVGLMGMASDTEDKSLVRSQFQRLRDARDTLQRTYADESSPLNALSMGMSQDYPIAIECGSTHIRVGSTLFG